MGRRKIDVDRVLDGIDYAKTWGGVFTLDNFT